MERYLVPAPLAVREVPDAGADHVSALAAGTVVEQSDRCGGWVRVRLPDGGDGWVDGRRLTPVQDATAPVVAPKGPGVEAHTEPPVLPSPSSASAVRRRPPALLVGTVVAAMVVLVVGAVVLLTADGAPPGAPTERAAVLLVEPRPGLVVAGDLPAAGGLWFGSAEGLVRLTRFDDRFLTFAPDEPFDLAEVSGFGGQEWRVVLARIDGTVTRWDEVDDARSTVSLPGEVRCCSPVVATGFADGAVVFTLGEEARSDTLCLLDFGAETAMPVALPRPGLVWDAVVVGDVVFVGMDTGLVAVGARDGCSAVLGEWDLSVSALAVASWPDAGRRVLALDPDAEAVTVLDPWGYIDTTDGCRPGARPQVLGAVDAASVAGRPLSLGSSFAAVGTAAYLLTTDGDLVILDVGEPTVPRSDRLLGTLTGFGADPGVLPRMAVLQPDPAGQAWVLVSEPLADRMWVIGPEAPESGPETVDLRSPS